MAIKMEKMCHEPGSMADSEIRKGKKIDCPPELPERVGALLTP